MIYHSFEHNCGCTPSRRPPHCCIPHCCCFHGELPPMPPQPPFPIQPRGLSILSTATTGAASVAAGGTIPFEVNNVSLGTDITHAAGTGIVTLNSPGVYLVSFNGTATPAAAAELPDLIEAELRLNGTAVPGASAGNTYTVSTDSASFAFTTAINVTTVPATLSVVVPEAGAIFSDASLTVQKLGTVPAPLTPPLIPTPYYPPF